MQKNIMTVLFVGILFPSILLFFHTHNLFKVLFPGVTSIDICGFYIIGFVTGVIGMFLIVKFYKEDIIE